MALQTGQEPGAVDAAARRAAPQRLLAFELSESSGSFRDPEQELVAGWRWNIQCFPDIPRLGEQTCGRW